MFVVPILDHSAAAVLEQVFLNSPCGVRISVPLDMVLNIVPEGSLTHNGFNLEVCDALAILGDRGIQRTVEWVLFLWGGFELQDVGEVARIQVGR